MSLSDGLKWTLCKGHFVLVAAALLVLLSGCASKPQVSRITPSAVSQSGAYPDFPQLIITVENQHGPIAANRIRHWAKLVEAGKRLDTKTQLTETNRFFNGARFLSDQEIWQTEDYWATPSEFLIKDAGDCEDFAIAKYFTLRFMGVEDEKMRINYVKSLTLNQAHMVLSYYPAPEEVPLVLDNLNPRILPADQRSDLNPVYSFNGERLWLARSRNEQVEAGKAGQIKLWQTLQNKLRQELGQQTTD